MYDLPPPATILGSDGRPLTASKAQSDGGGTILGYLGNTLSASEAKDLSDAEFYWHLHDHHPAVGSSVGLISDTIGGAGYQIVAPGPDLDQKEVDLNDPVAAALRFFLANVNATQDINRMMGEVSADMDVVGRAYIHVIRAPGGACVALERIDNRTMAPKLTPDGTAIKTFRQKVRGINGIVTTRDYEPKDIFYFRRSGADPILGGKSLLEQLDLTMGVDLGARRHNAAYFRNAARAGTYLINETANKDQLEFNKRVIEETRSGSDNAYRPIMLAGKWQLTVPKAGENDEEFGKSQDRALQEVCAVYHVPESKLKTTEGALGANGKEQDDQTFHEECITPRALYLWSWLTWNLRHEFPAMANLALMPKTKYSIRVSAIEDAFNALKSGATIAEARTLVGWVKLGASHIEGLNLDVPYVSTSVAPMNQPADPSVDPNKPPGDNPPEPKAKKARSMIRGRRWSRNSARSTVK